jgi:hypothetical protein
VDSALSTLRNFYQLGGVPDAQMFDTLVDLCMRTGQFKRALEVRGSVYLVHAGGEGEVPEAVGWRGRACSVYLAVRLLSMDKQQGWLPGWGSTEVGVESTFQWPAAGDAGGKRDPACGSSPCASRASRRTARGLSSVCAQLKDALPADRWSSGRLPARGLSV